MARPTLAAAGMPERFFNILHGFKSRTGDGVFLDGSLTLSDSTLYGMTEQGGSNNSGTIFRIGTDGLGNSILGSFHEFDGAIPKGDLTLSADGSILYGMTGGGGSGGQGVISR